MATLINKTGGKHRFARFTLPPFGRVSIADEVVDAQLGEESANGFDRLLLMVEAGQIVIESSAAPAVVTEQALVAVPSAPEVVIPPPPPAFDVTCLLALSTREAREFLSNANAPDVLVAWLGKETRKTIRKLIESAIASQA